MKNTISITDNRTGHSYELPINNGTIKANDLKQVKVDTEDFGIVSYDPAYLNTASCRSSITYIDGDKGVLLYRGYPIEQLAERSSYLEVAYLLLYGELPTSDQLRQFVSAITVRTFLPQNFEGLFRSFRYDAHPMGMFVSSIAALGTFYPDAKRVDDPECRLRNVVRMIAKAPTLAAWAYRLNHGFPFTYPDNSLSFTGNFLAMIKRMGERTYTPHPVLERALDVLFILHADHEQNCSTSAMRAIGSARGEPYSAMAGAAAALYGPLHGGANEAVLHMLEEIGNVNNVPAFIKQIKEGKGGQRLMGFGHRVYKSYDPRARIVKKMAEDVFEVTGVNPLLHIALELERIALEDEYFISRRLYPNVDFYTGLIYQAMGFPSDFFTVLFAVPRTVGWLAQWLEMISDPEQKIARPRQIYTGAGPRNYPGDSRRDVNLAPLP